MANNYFTLPNSEMYENSPAAVVNFQRFMQRRDTVQQQQQDVPNSRNSGSRIRIRSLSAGILAPLPCTL